MDRRLDWIVRNGAIAVALFFAVVGHVDWLHMALTACAWAMLVVSLSGTPQSLFWRALAPRAISPIAGMGFDLAVLAAMFVAHWYWTAFAYAASCACFALARSGAISKP